MTAWLPYLPGPAAAASTYAGGLLALPRCRARPGGFRGALASVLGAGVMACAVHLAG